MLFALANASSGLRETMAEGCRVTWSGSTKRRQRPWKSTSALYLSVSAIFAAQNAQAFFATCGLTSPSSLESVATGHHCAGGINVPLSTQRWSGAGYPRELLACEITQLLYTTAYRMHLLLLRLAVQRNGHACLIIGDLRNTTLLYVRKVPAPDPRHYVDLLCERAQSYTMI